MKKPEAATFCSSTFPQWRGHLEVGDFNTDLVEVKTDQVLAFSQGQWICYNGESGKESQDLE